MQFIRFTVYAHCIFPIEFLGKYLVLIVSVTCTDVCDN